MRPTYGVNTYIGDGSFPGDIFAGHLPDPCRPRARRQQHTVLTPPSAQPGLDRARLQKVASLSPSEATSGLDSGAIILGGVTIGKNSVIGAGTVITGVSRKLPRGRQPGRVVAPWTRTDARRTRTLLREALEETRLLTLTATLRQHPVESRGFNERAEQHPAALACGASSAKVTITGGGIHLISDDPTVVLTSEAERST